MGQVDREFWNSSLVGSLEAAIMAAQRLGYTGALDTLKALRDEAVERGRDE